AILVPGMPNVHSHAFQRGMAGLAERRGTSADTFWTWREVMYRFALAITPDQVEAIASQLYVEMLEAGFSRVGEFHYLHHDRDGRDGGKRADPYPCRRAMEGGGGLPSLVGQAPSRMAARPCRDRPPLEPYPRHPYDRPRDETDGCERRLRRPVPNHGGQSGRR